MEMGKFLEYIFMGILWCNNGDCFFLMLQFSIANSFQNDNCQFLATVKVLIDKNI